MKVLFAVSSENISDAIIKKYQKQYKEILSYKNVYYFNAILKEIQKDKTYDRIIISEDLEPFSNNNYDTIDKFIFEKLDSISDEAQDSAGKETSIILICTDRRQKGNSILLKLFGIGVYNALLGNDRSMEEVCKLIKKPRTKKEAKLYYQIDSEDVNYKAENENEVSEYEIQNILMHFKRLNKKPDSYASAFNKIADQYNDEQLKIVINCLPVNVKAVLETTCERYQEIMSLMGGIPSVKDAVNSENELKPGIKSRSIGQAGNIQKPIVIPSAVRNAKNQAQAVKTISKPATTMNNINSKPVRQEKIVEKTSNTDNIRIQKPVANNSETIVKPIVERKESETIPIVEDNNVKSEIQQPVNAVQTPGFQRQRRVFSGVPGIERNPQSTAETSFVEENENQDENFLPGFEEDNVNSSVLPGIEQDNINENDLGINLDGLDESVMSLDTNVENDNYVDDDNVDNDDVTNETISRRGRGRPRKTLVEGAVLKPKGKRGRPRKIQEVEEIEDLEESSTMLPGIGMEENNEEDIENIYEEPSDEEAILPGFEDDYSEEEQSDEEVATMLPGMGFEDEINEETSNESSNEMELENETNTDEEYTNEVELPGLDDLDDFDSNEDELYEDGNSELLPGFEDNEQFDSNYSEEDDLDLLPGFEDNTSDEGQGSEELLSGINDEFVDDDVEDDKDELLPGIGNFEETYDDNQPVNNNLNTNVIESIKPKVDYSMSSLNSLITKDKKIVTFIGTSKNGVSFLVNNLATLFSSLGINTAILDMTQNKNSYYIYTKNEDELRNIAFNSIEKLQNGYAEGIRVDKNLSVYTSLPNDGKNYLNAEPILSTLVQNHSLILIDCDYDTDLSYFASCQEMYLVQSMDILTIQPLTAFLRELKTNGILEPEKIRVVINKELKVRSLSIKAIIGGISYYNDPGMSFMTELFNKDMVKACTIPFDESAYSKYLEGIVNCNISLNGFSKTFKTKLQVLGDMIYPLVSKQTYNNRPVQNYNQNNFSNSINDTLNKMRKKY